ncbi:MAG: Gfo/Idh/MocA family oxidoreductase [Gemmatimonadota bacterium]|nr:Gfo/Idh/MocA family oxidoreductase [Gemmatimonadota bacterium]MDH5759617.1 Gfo/Idh/MocA family oxidoreductase [Gemmatimonadota bacterium]
MSTRSGEADLSIAFLGCGAVARRHGRTLARHFPALRRFYASRDPDVARDLCAEVKGAGHYSSYADAMTSAAVDAVMVTTPPDRHLPLTLQALEAGKHVIVEKPAFLHAEDFDEVARVAERAGRTVLVAENYFYKPTLERIRETVGSGVLGQVRFVQLNAVKLQTTSGWRNDPSASGGGALFEGGVHWVNFMANLGLDLTTVRGFFPGSPATYERSALLVGEYAQGAVGSLSYSWEIRSTLKGLRLSRIWGTNGSILFESNGLFLLRSGRRPSLTIPGPTDLLGFRAMFRDFIEALTTGRTPRMTLDMARRDIALVEQAYATALQSPPPSTKESLS